VLYGQSPEWKQAKAHNKTNRWEGLLPEDQGGVDWELRSFLGDAVESYPGYSGVDLTLAWYVPDESKAFVKAQEIIPALYYVMEPKPEFLTNTRGWRYFGKWSTLDVLIQNKITSDRLGVLIKLGDASDGASRLAPGIVYYSNAPKRITTYDLDFVTMRALRKFNFEVLASGNYKRLYPMDAQGDRSIVRLKFDATGLPEGPAKVVISAPHEKDKDKLDLQVDFYNKRLP
jgi:hypothetical protein